MRLLLFVQVALMLCWRLGVLSLLLFTVAPSWNGYPQLIVGIPLLASAVIVFGLRRTLRPFPLVRLLTGRNPVPTQVQVAAAAAERAGQRPLGYREAARLQQERANIAAHRQAELDHARRVAEARGPQAESPLSPPAPESPCS